MNAEVEPVTPAEADWVASQRVWTQGWRRVGLSALPLTYLGYVAVSVYQNSRGAGQVLGYLILGAFALCWLAAPVLLMLDTSRRRFWSYFGVLLLLLVLELPFARAAGFVICVFLTIITVGRLGRRSAPFVLVYALAALIVPVAIPSWHVSLDASFGDVTPVAIPIVALTMFGVLQILRGNQALADARAELARLSAENERVRIARDLHDLLGHSLTTITVKAGLARRLGESDPAQAYREIAEVETLARRSLADVRAAVSGYHDVTLTGELAAGRELLRAAGVTADLPHASDVVDSAYSELFGWVVREGLTNIVRHARASSCVVRLYPAVIEIVDDGLGDPGQPGTGNGLSGLCERVTAAGGGVEAGPVQPQGWRLRVTMAPASGPAPVLAPVQGLAREATA
jgi:two-component system sensor histidine kinase DesK